MDHVEFKLLYDALNTILDSIVDLTLERADSLKKPLIIYFISMSKFPNGISRTNWCLCEIPHSRLFC